MRLVSAALAYSSAFQNLPNFNDEDTRQSIRALKGPVQTDSSSLSADRSVRSV